MDAKEYIGSISIETKEEYKDYQDLMFKTVENGLKNNLSNVDFTWKGLKTQIDLNHISFLIGYNYAVTKTLMDLEEEDRVKNNPSATK